MNADVKVTLDTLLDRALTEAGETEHSGLNSATMPWRNTGGRSTLGVHPCVITVVAIGGTNTGSLDSLLMEGSIDLTVIEESAESLENTKQRLGPLAKYIAWKHTHVLDADIPKHAFDVWFDQTWFGQLPSEAERARYMEQVQRALRPGGTAFIDGQVIRYAAS